MEFEAALEEVLEGRSLDASLSNNTTRIHYTGCPLNTGFTVYEKALKVQILNEVALRQVVRKRVSFQDR